VLAIQLVPYGRDHANPPVVAEPQWDSPKTRELAVRVCFDCHSNETVWPWYSTVAPFSWLIWPDVARERAKGNWSEWGLGFDDESRGSAETVRDHSMPPGSSLPSIQTPGSPRRRWTPWPPVWKPPLALGAAAAEVPGLARPTPGDRHSRSLGLSSGIHGPWLSLVERLSGGQEVVGSNPAGPTLAPPGPERSRLASIHPQQYDHRHGWPQGRPHGFGRPLRQ
jgi:hypothetical protein